MKVFEDERILVIVFSQNPKKIIEMCFYNSGLFTFHKFGRKIERKGF